MAQGRSKAKKRSKGYEAGLAMRKKVLGADYVEASLKNAGAFHLIKAVLPEIEALERASGKKRK